MKPVHVIGGGMAGCEAVWQIARAGVPAVLHEMRPHVTTDAHRTGELDHMEYAVAEARRGWIEKKNVLNTMSAAQFTKVLKKHRE